MAVEYRRHEGVKAVNIPADMPAAPVRRSLIQRIGEFAPVPLTEATPPLPHDDLTQIRGIGPRLAERLNLLGVARFDQIAAWTAIDVHRLSVILGLGRTIATQNWTEQAALLCREASATKSEQAQVMEANGVLDAAAREADNVLPIAEEPERATARIRRVAGGLLDALARELRPYTLRDINSELENEAGPECVTEQAPMPNFPETRNDIGIESSLDRAAVAESPPPLPQGPLRVAYWPDELEDDEHGLRMIAALTTMPSLEPDCADLMMEEADITPEEADITIVERAPVALGEEDGAAARGEVATGGSLQAGSHGDDAAPDFKDTRHAGYYDDLGEATVEIYDVAEGDEGDDALDPEERTPRRRRFFSALTGDGG